MAMGPALNMCTCLNFQVGEIFLDSFFQLISSLCTFILELPTQILKYVMKDHDFSFIKWDILPSKPCWWYDYGTTFPRKVP